jgi:phosphoribosylformimino-5-aminoimidazole carboxamide ribotide isomerase
MIIYPAIDLKDGKCVRLYKGDMEAATIYNTNPASQAQKFVQDGFKYLHIVDLNGAIDGTPINKNAVKDILKEINIPTQLGGGIRSLQHIEHWLNAGLSRVILGTIAVKNPELVREACRLFPGQIVLGIDAYGEDVAVEGWVEKSETTIYDLAQEFEDAGATAIIYTDINRDGTGEGLNIGITHQLAKTTSIPVIASGGVGSISDLHALSALSNPPINGVIVGRALYDNKISAKEVLNA